MKNIVRFLGGFILVLTSVACPDKHFCERNGSSVLSIVKHHLFRNYTASA